MSCIGIVVEIKDVETFRGRFEFNKSLGCVYFEDTTAILAVIRDMVFLA